MYAARAAELKKRRDNMIQKKFITLKLSELIPYENNPRINYEAVNDVVASIQQCENIDPIEIDENNVILSGHTRLKALKKLKYKETEVIQITGLSDEQKRKYRILANKTGETAEWDLSKLEIELTDLDFEGYDFDFDGIDFTTESDDPAEIVEDDYNEEPPAEPKAKLGDIYQLGRHRLMCGDSTKAEDMLALMGNDRADMVFTDPPYNVAIGTKNAAINAACKQNGMPLRGGRIEEDIIGDKGMTDEEIGETLWKPAFVNMRDVAKDCCNIYVTMPQGGSHMMMMMMMSAAWQVKHELIWVKNQPTFSMGRLDYDYQHEPICYGWNKSHCFYGKGEQNKSIWHFDKPRESKLHPTMKPIPLVVNAILNSSKEDDIILDAFGGSGTTIIACEQTKRNARVMEYDPKYVDVIIGRWEKFTGQKANKLN